VKAALRTVGGWRPAQCCPRVKRYLSALLMRALPTVQPPAFMSDASESVRRAWAAVSASVTEYLPTELPSLPRLPRLPALSLPKISLPQVPAISPPLGRFFSSLTTLMFAPGQIHGLAIYYQVAMRNMICDPDAGPRVEWVDEADLRMVDQKAPAFRATLSDSPQPAVAGVTRMKFEPAARGISSAMVLLLPASALLPTVPISELTALNCLEASTRDGWVDLAAQGMRVRGQLPPPHAAANFA